ncbi:PREDICTED: uncharacterized protein LOC105568551 isoform X2 [Vollenhovia emeryi]|uniref:uncharacterized protein LOC105568551 isoform X2 n=1 Tax=Vollenhovia emeryi TaxID=411798 RepID=UPI0005F3E0DA|nr:PREDICTED: uncharacterized protein LOC105568551 isoform X2 [Vollenhovia emeryi]
MEHRSRFHIVLALIVTIEVTPAPVSDFQLGHRTVWQDVGRRSFYGPWDNSVKRNGEYIDYNDYGVHLEQFRPNSPELPYDDVSIANGYIDALPSTYDSGLPGLNTLLGSVGLADFRTGVRTADWIDQSTDGFKEQHWEDIASHKIDEDTEELDGFVTPIATR